MNKIIAIAINQYSDPDILPLSNCLNDIKEIISILSAKYEFDFIELYTSMGQTTLSFLYHSLSGEFINSLPEDNILLLFAGHGEHNPHLKTSYWLCSNSSKSDPSTWLSLNTLLDFFNASKSKHIALISDSCFSGSIFEKTRGGGIAALEGKYSRQGLTSGGIEKVSDGQENDFSPFSIALQKVLKSSHKKSLSFTELSEQTILEFSKDRAQTPGYGSLVNCGHKGGTYMFKLKSGIKTDIIIPLHLPLELNNKINIESSCVIPFFNQNELFNSSFINAFVQQLGYTLINDIRIYFKEDESFLIERSKKVGFDLDVRYTIETFNDKFLSILISRSDMLGGIHPNYYTHSLNFAFKPDRKLSLFDLISLKSFKSAEEFLRAKIQAHSEEECREVLIQYTSYEYIQDLDFTFTDETFSIHFTNLLPHAFKACGSVDIPIEEIKFKL